jgi:DNA modification methylase
MIDNTTQQPTLAHFATPIRHPARYSDALLPVMAQYLTPGMRVLDPFAGVGTIQRLSFTGAKFFTGEIEYRVCEHSAGTRRVCADAQLLPFASESVDAVMTSPTYGNRMADTFVDGSERNTYTAAFGFSLHENNAGAMQWGLRYQWLHEGAYKQCYRVLKQNGLMVVNVSDHIRDGERVYVARWHYATLSKIGFDHIVTHEIKTPRNRKGQNGNARVESEYIFVFRK